MINNVRAGYKKIMSRKRNRILIRITICVVFIFSLVKWTVFVASQYGNDTPTKSIKTEVMSAGINLPYFNTYIWDSLFLEVEEVDSKECQPIMDEPGFNSETQKVYRITKNIPSNSAGYWIVTEVKGKYGSQYLTDYYGY